MSTISNSKLHSCTHCHEECKDELVWLEDKPFCCLGCKTVFEILDHHDLCDYYTIDRPRNKISQVEFGERFAFLDTEEIANQLFHFKEKDFRTVVFYVPNIHCSSCIWLLENLHRLNEGISSSKINFLKKTVKINFQESDVSLRQVVELMASIGYPPDINLEGTKAQSKKKEQTQLLIKLGVAGFCFGNVMLMSFPEYLSFSFKDEADYIKAFSWLNLILSIPIMVYSARDYYISAIKGIKHNIINIDVPISLGILVLFLRSSYEVISQSGFGYFDSLTGLVFFLLIGKWFQSKTYQSMSFERDFKSYFPLAVTLIQGPDQKGVLVNQLKNGDQILVRNGELIPSDSILVSEKSTIDYSFVTGESEPIRKQKGELIYAGGRQLGEPIYLIVQKPVSQSYLTDLWNQSAFRKEDVSRYGSLIDRVSQYFTLTIILIAVSSLIYWLLNDSSLAFQAFTAVLIIACPCALALSIPFTHGNVIRLLGNKGFYLKNSEVIEQLASVNTIVFDKTGTITQNKGTEVVFFGETRLSKLEESYIKALCNGSNHPLSLAISNHLLGTDGTSEIQDFQEIAGKGIMGKVAQYELRLGSADFLQVKESGSSGSVHVMINNEYKGFYKVVRQNRKGYAEMLSDLKKGGYELHLISGDHNIELEQWLPHFDQVNVHFNQSPQDKLSYIQQLIDSGKKVAMVGDGLNDAGALKQAQVGIAISEDVYSFSPACDGILSADKFSFLKNYIGYSKGSMRIVKASFALSFLYNIVGMYFAVQGMLTPIVAAILMPLSSVSVVVFVTVLTNLTAPKSIN